MSNLQTSYEYKVWTDDYIIPKTTPMNFRKSSSPPCQFFMIQLRVQRFIQYLPAKGDCVSVEARGSLAIKDFYLPRDVVIHDQTSSNSIYQTLRSGGMPLFTILPIIRGLSSFARDMMSKTDNIGRTLIPICLAIAVTFWDPRDVVMAAERNLSWTPEIEEETPTAKREEKEEECYMICINPYLDHWVYAQC